MRIFVVRLVKLVGVLFAIFLAVSAPAIWSFGTVYWYQRNPVAFDQSIWLEAEKNNHANSTYVRLQMASSLVEDGLLIDKSESEIASLLGTPQNHVAIPGVAYWLSPFGLDSMWLLITYRDGIVEKVSIVGD